jgi:hypothetical protein
MSTQKKPFDNIPDVLLAQHPHLDKPHMILLDDRAANQYLNGDQVIVVPCFR